MFVMLFGMNKAYKCRNAKQRKIRRASCGVPVAALLLPRKYKAGLCISRLFKRILIFPAFE